MEGEKPTKMTRKCSTCGESGHNSRSCPQKQIDDTFVRGNTIERDNTEYEYVEETISENPKRDSLILHLLDRQAYGIEPDIFEVWLHNDRPCQLKDVKYIMNRNLNKDSILLYLRILKDIDILY